jgi:hypothetical protein
MRTQATASHLDDSAASEARCVRHNGCGSSGGNGEFAMAEAATRDAAALAGGTATTEPFISKAQAQQPKRRLEGAAADAPCGAQLLGHANATWGDRPTFKRPHPLPDACAGVGLAKENALPSPEQLRRFLLGLDAEQEASDDDRSAPHLAPRHLGGSSRTMMDAFDDMRACVDHDGSYF